MPRRLPSPALVVASLALAVALGGTTYAATALPKNSVGEKQLKSGSVSTVKLAKGSVTSRQIKDHTIVAADLAKNAYPALPGKVASAGHADTAGRADSAAHAASAARPGAQRPAGVAGGGAGGPECGRAVAGCRGRDSISRDSRASVAAARRRQAVLCWPAPATS